MKLKERQTPQITFGCTVIILLALQIIFAAVLQHVSPHRVNMTEAKALRCLVSGDVCGQFASLFKRVRSLQNKGANFDLLMCVGDFFDTNQEEWERYTSGELKVPISTLILGPNRAEHTKYYDDGDGQEMCPNVTYLGRRGRYTGSSGLKIAYLSGIDGDNKSTYHFTTDDVSALTKPVTADTNFTGVDILLTSQWPHNVDKYGKTVERGQSSSSPMIGEVARVLKPRYHFAGLNDIFYERQPYRNHQVLVENARHVTRFLGLAPVGNPKKEKFLYAFTITPMCHLTTAERTHQPSDATESPYKPLHIASSDGAQGGEGAQFFYDMNAGDKTGKRSRQQEDGQNKKRKPAQPSGPCWFCLGSPEVEKHLVVSVGTDTYLALAKGGLVDDHVLILPIGHYQSYITAPTEVQEEIQKYKKSLKKYFKSRGKSVVFYERNYRTQHLQIQVIPVPCDVSMSVKEMFMEMAEGESIELAEIPQHSDLTQIVPAGAPYFYAELPCGGKLLHRISKNFPLQFAREVVAQPEVLNVPERIDWRNCAGTKESSAELAADFKSDFKEFDFNLT